MKLHKITAFSLIELSIVLVILALLTGGIFTGKELLDSAKYRNISAQAHLYSEAINKFKHKYGAMPGDMVNATEIWGRADSPATFSGQCAVPATNTSTTSTVATCNGNGNGLIAYDTTNFLYEMHRAWQHLRNAEFIKGSYSGVGQGGSPSRVVGGVNAPTVNNIAGSSYDIRFIDTPPSGYYGNQSYRHVLHFGKVQTGNNYAHAPIISAADAQLIDAKTDDGLPGTGNIVTFNKTTHANCASNDNPLTAVYLMSNAKNEDCVLIFKTGL